MTEIECEEGKAKETENLLSVLKKLEEMGKISSPVHKSLCEHAKNGYLLKVKAFLRTMNPRVVIMSDRPCSLNEDCWFHTIYQVKK